MQSGREPPSRQLHWCLKKDIWQEMFAGVEEEKEIVGPEPVCKNRLKTGNGKRGSRRSPKVYRLTEGEKKSEFEKGGHTGTEGFCFLKGTKICICQGREKTRSWIKPEGKVGGGRKARGERGCGRGVPKPK